MLLTISVILFFVIIVIDVIHYGALYIFLKGIRRNEWTKPSGEFVPKTMVLLALRGVDPFLKRCLEGLLTQDYPNYAIRLIVDHPEDSALSVAKAIVETRGAKNVEFIIVDEHFETCTLKCNSLYHAVLSLDLSYEVVVILDADTNPHSGWLRQLVEPLSDPRFAAATGQRWYIPETSNPGSLIRYLWNAAAVIQLYFYRIAWGGSLALRRELFTEGNLLDIWKTAFTDDAAISESVKRLGSKIVFVPSLFMVNRETCTLQSFHRWVKRQLLCVKLHHPAWKAVAFQGILITLPLLVCSGLLVTGLMFWEKALIYWNLGTFVVYWGGVLGTLPMLERAIRKRLSQRGEQLQCWTLGNTIRILPLIPVTQIVYTSALIQLYFLRRVEWRGVEYEIGHGNQVRLIEYKPYNNHNPVKDNSHSI
ncbi:MAG: glycosyltransferase family 2 protein [Planctomycetaceae bacterium]|jgi:cellulose synthase/poly-beta-1,6-N-acetylglucosamine synthase-like glycosyltransferase|nr:glycosyltransferase family 2 protein [Planctomycetaceae bacterium]